nr:hypothetical protein [Rubrobacter sp.]
MNQRLYGVGVLLVALAMLTLSAQAMAAGKPVPFKGQSRGVVTTVGFDPVAKIAYTSVAGQGQATLLGQFTATAVAEVDVTTGNAKGT